MADDLQAMIAKQTAAALETELVASAAQPTPVGNGEAVLPARPAAETAPSDMAKVMAMLEQSTKEISQLKRQLNKQPVEAAPAAKPTIKSVEQQVAELTERYERAESLRKIERDLPSVPEYGTLKSVPNLADLVYTTIQEEQRAAREAGEGEVTVTAAQALRKIKQSYVDRMRAEVMSNPELLKEIGLSVPAATTAASTGRTLGADVRSSGSLVPKTTSKNVNDLVKAQVQAALQVMTNG